MTFESMSNEDRLEPPEPKGDGRSSSQSRSEESKVELSSSESRSETQDSNNSSPQSESAASSTSSATGAPTITDQNSNSRLLSDQSCPAKYPSHLLDDEIRSRLDKLNALSDLINSLERHFNEANSVFRETLKCSTERLSSIARTLGSKSIRQGRIYHAVKISVEQSQSDCQRACVRFEKANQDHQVAKNAIREAEAKLKEVARKHCTEENFVITNPSSRSIETLDLEAKLTLSDRQPRTESRPSSCDSGEKANSLPKFSTRFSSTDHEQNVLSGLTSPSPSIEHAAKFSEDLNQAVLRLIDAEKERGLSEREHMDQANKLILAQDKLTRLERDYSLAIRRTQYYFDEARRFNAKLNSVKSDICQISGEILAAKQAYAKTLRELEQFSEDLHYNAESLKL